MTRLHPYLQIRKRNGYTNKQTKRRRKTRGRRDVNRQTKRERKSSSAHLSLYNVQKKVRFPATTEKLTKS